MSPAAVTAKRMERVSMTAEVGRAEELRSLVPAGVGVVEDRVEDRPDSADDVARVAGVVNEDAVGREGQRVA